MDPLQTSAGVRQRVAHRCSSCATDSAVNRTYTLLRCVRCASRGSGSAELDERAAAVLERLRGDERLSQLQIVAERVVWMPHAVGVVFSDREQPSLFPKEQLVALKAEPLACALVMLATLGAGRALDRSMRY